MKGKEYTEAGDRYTVTPDLSRYFDTLYHELLLNILSGDVKDERVMQWIKRYLRSGVLCAHSGKQPPRILVLI